MGQVEIRPVDAGDKDWIAHLLEEHWGGTMIVSRGRVHHADELAGFIASAEKCPVGLITYRLDGAECEIVTLNSLAGGMGVGSMLLEAAKKTAGRRGCRRVWLVTTNDNTPAQRFYQRRGFTVAAIHADAIESARRLKPTIPERGLGGVPIRDEIEFEFIL